MSVLALDPDLLDNDSVAVGAIADGAVSDGISIVDTARSVMSGDLLGVFPSDLDRAVEEVRLCAEIMAIKAEQMRYLEQGLASLAASLGSRLDGLVGRLDFLLQTSGLEGCHSGSDGIDESELRRELLGMTPDEARDWFDGLPESTRELIYAVHPDVFKGTYAEASFSGWLDELGSADLRRVFELRAIHNAGIDECGWDPAQGLDRNLDTVNKVYEYYGQMYLDNPELAWTAMAALIGPSFAGGMHDLEDMSDLAARVRRLAEAYRAAPGIPGGLVPEGVAAIGEMSAAELEEELRWYQQEILEMQKEIFYDQAPMHEAYLDGGAELVERILEDDPYKFGEETAGAWNDIASGDPDRIAAGNQTLLRREQEYVIADDYEDMYGRPVTGKFVTYAMTQVGSPSIEGAKSFAEVFPWTPAVEAGTPERVPLGWIPLVDDDVSVPLPHVEASIGLETPLADGNIAHFDDRWALIKEDTWPAFIDQIENHPDDVAAELRRPFEERASEQKLTSRLEDLVGMIDNWGLDGDLDVGFG